MEFNTNGTNQKLWIFGDSFTGMHHHTESWMWLAYKSFVGNTLHISSRGSRDVQTIIDIFLKNLKDIKNDDFVILMLPSMTRFRLPLNEPKIDVEFSTEARVADEKIKHLDYFIGNGYYISTGENILEEPINTLDYKIFKHAAPNEEPSVGSIISMINASNANLKNTNEMLESFIQYFPFKLVIYSWTDESYESVVKTKSVIKNEIGFWHTLYDMWKESDGKEGREGDVHWSKKMDKAFSEYIINEYPEYFKKS